MRRPNPDRIREAQRAGIRARMTGQWRVRTDRADEILNAWEAQAAAVESPAMTHRSVDEGWLRARLGEV